MVNERILLKNSYYPDGLTDQQVQKHYKKYQKDILKELQGRNAALIVCPSENEFVWLRNYKGKPIVIKNRRDFQNIIHERVLCIYAEVGRYEKKIVLDVDCTNYKNAAIAIQYLYQLFMESQYVRDIQIVFTGKESFHLHMNVVNKTSILRCREIVEKVLHGDPKVKTYLTINQKRQKNEIPNVDFSTLKERALYICPYSISKEGLICTPIDLKSLNNFNPNNYKIR